MRRVISVLAYARAALLVLGMLALGVISIAAILMDEAYERRALRKLRRGGK